MTLTPAGFVGIDVSKETLDVYILSTEQYFQVPNQPDFQTLLQRLEADAKVVLEPTGGYELPVAQALLNAGITVYRPHVVRMSYHARSVKLLAKTDKLDARALAHYGACNGEELRPYQQNEEQEQFKALVQRREQLIESKVQEMNRCGHQALPLAVQQSIAKNIKWLNRQIKQMEAQIRQVVSGSPKLKQRQEIMLSMPSIGEIASWTLLSSLPELGEVDRKKIGALAGVVPVIRKSGQSEKQAHIFGGRAEIRKVLYMSVLSALRYNEPVKAFYKRLKTNGKSAKEAIVACMHKILRMLNAMLKNNQTFQTAH